MYAGNFHIQHLEQHSLAVAGKISERDSTDNPLFGQLVLKTSLERLIRGCMSPASPKTASDFMDQWGIKN